MRRSRKWLYKGTYMGQIPSWAPNGFSAKKFPEFYRAWRFITRFTKARHLSLSCLVFYLTLQWAVAICYGVYAGMQNFPVSHKDWKGTRNAFNRTKPNGCSMERGTILGEWPTMNAWTCLTHQFRDRTLSCISTVVLEFGKIK